MESQGLRVYKLFLIQKEFLSIESTLSGAWDIKGEYAKVQVKVLLQLHNLRALKACLFWLEV